MSDIRASGPTFTVTGWFRRDVPERLSTLVGGRAHLRVILLLASVLALENADNATVGAVAAPLEAALHIGNTQLGLLVTASTGVGALATLPLGVLVDRVQRVRLLIGAIVVWSVAMVVSSLAVSYPMLLVTRLALGAVVATAGPAISSLTGDLFRPAERGRIFGYILSGELVGAAGGLLISGNIAAVFSWRASFLILSVPGFILAVALHRLLPEPDRGGNSQLGPEDLATGVPGEAGVPPEPDTGKQADEGEIVQEVQAAAIEPHRTQVLHVDPIKMSLPNAVRYVLSVRTNLVLIIASALGYFFFAGLRTFAVEFLRGRFGLGQSTASTLLVVIGAGSIIGVLISGRLADRLIGQGHIAARPLVTGIAFLAAAAMFVPGLLVTPLLAAMPLIFLAGLAYGATNPPLDAARLDIIQHHLWGRAEAVRTLLRSLVTAAAPLVFGIISTSFGGRTAGFGAASGSKPNVATATSSATGLDTTFLIMLVPLGFAALILLTFARRTYPRDVATAIASEHNTRHRPHSQRPRGMTPSTS